MIADDDNILRVDRLSKHFGGLNIIRDLNLSVRRKNATALIGPNGAGKTTVFNLVSGVFRPSGGQIVVNGNDITTMPSRHRIGIGLARSFQNIRLMPHLTVLENLLIGQHARASSFGDLLFPFRLMPSHPWKREAMDALAECRLAAHAHDFVGSLPYGIRKRIDLVRATLARPSLLLLDEPAAGLNATETDDLRRHLELMIDRGITLFVIEHDMNFIRSICDHVVVLNFGEKIAEGTLAAVQRDPAVREAYLGPEAEV